VAQLPHTGVPRTPDGKPNYSAAAPRTADGKPDLSGIWVSTAGQVNDPILGLIARPLQRNDIDAGVAGGLPLQFWAQDLRKTRQATNVTGSPISHCLPPGPILTHTITQHGAVLNKFIQTPGLLVILSEYNMMYRQIFMDGRPLPTDPQPSWNGYSTGKWNGDTLVVETNGLRDGLWLDLRAGTPITDAAKLTERQVPPPELRQSGDPDHSGRRQGVHQAVDYQVWRKRSKPILTCWNSCVLRMRGTCRTSKNDWCGPRQLTRKPAR
jgi:hypothetical protein